jgi:hypothetical protein
MREGIFYNDIITAVSRGVRETVRVKVIGFRFRESPEVFLENIFAKMVQVINQFLVHLAGFGYLMGPGAADPGVKNRKTEQAEPQERYKQNEYERHQHIAFIVLTLAFHFSTILVRKIYPLICSFLLTSIL